MRVDDVVGVERRIGDAVQGGVVLRVLARGARGHAGEALPAAADWTP